MGRHTAPDGDTMDPVVAAALARRAAEYAGAHRDDAWDRSATQRIGGDVGWPGEPPAPGGGLGWPGDDAQADAQAWDDDVAEDRVPEPSAATEPSAAHDVAGHPGEPTLQPAVRRRGWRRLLGLDRAA